MFISADVLVLLGNIAMATWGAVVRYVFLLTKRGQDLKLLLAGVVSAVFLGVVVFLAAPSINISTKLSFVVSGLLGFSGPDAIDMLRRLVMFKVFGLKKDDYEGPVPTTDAEEAGKRG
jgi:hypothetical protein